MLQTTATRLCPLLVGLPLEVGERGILGIAKDGDLARREIPKGPASTVPPSSRAFSTAAARDETPHCQPANVQDGAWLSDIGYDPNGLDGMCLLSARRTPSDASGVLPENQSSEVWALRKGTLPSYLQGYLLPVLPRRRHSGRGFDNSQLLLYFLQVKQHCGQQVEWMSAPTFSVFRNSS
jgi:hypothetical protein